MAQIPLKTVTFHASLLPQILDRYNVAIVATFGLRSASKEARAIELCVCTTHLLYNPKRSDVRGAQTQVLLAELDRLACHSVTKEPLPIILTGDFNSPPHSAVYCLIVDGEIKKKANERQLPTEMGITDHCQHHAVVAKDERKETSVREQPRGLLIIRRFDNFNLIRRNLCSCSTAPSRQTSTGPRPSNWRQHNIRRTNRENSPTTQ